jgi:hypothetical protein
MCVTTMGWHASIIGWIFHFSAILGCLSVKKSVCLNWIFRSLYVNAHLFVFQINNKCNTKPFGCSVVQPCLPSCAIRTFIYPLRSGSFWTEPTNTGRLIFQWNEFSEKIHTCPPVAYHFSLQKGVLMFAYASVCTNVYTPRGNCFHRAQK